MGGESGLDEFLDGLSEEQARAFMELTIRGQILSTTIYGDEIIKYDENSGKTTIINPKDPEAINPDSSYTLPDNFSLNSDHFAVPDGYEVLDISKLPEFGDIKTRFPNISISQDGKIRDEIPVCKCALLRMMLPETLLL